MNTRYKHFESLPTDELLAILHGGLENGIKSASLSPSAIKTLSTVCSILRKRDVQSDEVLEVCRKYQESLNRKPHRPKTEAERKHELICETYQRTWQHTQSAPEYMTLRKEMEETRLHMEPILEGMPRESRLVIEFYILFRENMGRRMLECACAELLFPET